MPPDVWRRLGEEFGRRGWLAPSVDADAFVQCRTYAQKVCPDRPYELLCPAILTVAAPQAEAVETSLAAEVVPLDRHGPGWSYGYHRLGPVIRAFAVWAWSLPLATGGRVAGLMRDGGLLADALDAVRPGQRIAKPWLSRRLCLAGAIRSGTDREAILTLLVRARGQPAAVAEALADLGLTEENPPAGLIATDRLSGPALSALLDWLGHPPLSGQVARHCRTVRRRILGHLDRLELLDADRLLLVDVGYAGSIQRGLAAILRLEGRTVPLAGAYMLTTPGLLWALREGGGDAAGFLAHLGAPDWVAACFLPCREVFESFCATSSGPLRGYDQDGRPLMDPSPLPAEQLEQVGRIQAGALARCAGDAATLDRDQARRALVRLLDHPEPAEVAMIGPWLYDDGLALGHPRRLTESRPGHPRPLLWPQGAAALEG